ncbi:MAG: hypothetical protein ABSC41_20910, partial [Acidimicrobiales bacterium]
MTTCIDQEVVIRQLTEKIERTASARQRTMLERVREHANAEAAGSLQGLMNTLSSNPAYHFWDMQAGDIGPNGRDGVSAYYSHFVKTRQHFLEYNCDRIIVDDEHVVMEAVLKLVVPGDVLAANPMLTAMDINEGDHYLMTLRNLVIWPFDDKLM